MRPEALEGADAVSSGEGTASALSGVSDREVRQQHKISLALKTVAHLANKLSMPQEKRDRVRSMLEHGRSLEEVIEVTRLSMYTGRRLRQQLMAARIIQRNRKAEGAAQHDFSNSEQVTHARPMTAQIVQNIIAHVFSKEPVADSPRLISVDVTCEIF